MIRRRCDQEHFLNDEKNQEGQPNQDLSQSLVGHVGEYSAMMFWDDELFQFVESH